MSMFLLKIIRTAFENTQLRFASTESIIHSRFSFILWTACLKAKFTECHEKDLWQLGDDQQDDLYLFSLFRLFRQGECIVGKQREIYPLP